MSATGAAARKGGKRVCWEPVLRVTVSSEPPQGRNAARIRVRCRVRGGSSYMPFDSGRLQDPHLPCGSSHIVWFCISMRSVYAYTQPNGVAPVAQWIEHLITVQKVGGSSPFGRAAAPLGAIHRRGFCICEKHSFGSAFFMPAEAPARPPRPLGTCLTRSAASPPTARSTRNAAPQSPGPPRYLRRNAPRARQEMPR